MAQYIVEMEGSVRELYLVDADNAEEAKDKWADSGEPFLSESFGMEYATVKPA